MRSLGSWCPFSAPARTSIWISGCLGLLGWSTPGLGEGGSWTQWGGPNRDFKVSVPGLADSWPEEGPHQLWSRELGAGYSAILFEEGRLYTHYRKDDSEVLVALDAKTGETVWEHASRQPLEPAFQSQFGPGPRATPALGKDRVFAIGVFGFLSCVEKATGKELWSLDLREEFKATDLIHGYSSSPLVFRDKLIVLTGGRGASVVCVNQSDGSVDWKRHDFGNSYSTPQLVTVGGQGQVFCFMEKQLVSLDPETGELHWEIPVSNQWRHNISPPVFDDRDNTLVLSSTYFGSKGFRLEEKEAGWTVEELWSTLRVQFYHVTAVGVGDYVYGSHGNGTGQVSLYSCLDRKTGKIAWKERGLGKANTLYAGEKFLLLDEDGTLALVRATPEEFQVISTCKVSDGVTWTVPTLVGTVLFFRDNRRVAAFDLGEAEATSG